MTLDFAALNFQRHFATLPTAFYQTVQPQGIDSAELVVSSADCANLLELSLDSLNHAGTLAMLAGQTTHPAWSPLAMKYMGHQFGYLNPDLGDGRGLLLSEVKTSKGELLDLHLKGAGMTPYSRQGDGRAVLRSSIREFLCSEAMPALGIPSSRALCVVGSQTPVYREQTETAATLLRVSRSHIRFGHFEYAYHSAQPELLHALCDYTAQRYYPCLAGSANQNADLFLLTAQKTAEMIAHWQVIGFAHGVMNTDNMSILGETFDYGPFAFLDRFDAGYICNHSDHQGRYAFDRQPAIAHWNLSVLAQAMSPVVEKDALNEGLSHYNEVFNRQYMQGMRRKLGLQTPTKEDEALVFSTLKFLAHNGLDYSYFFRCISEHNPQQYRPQDYPWLRDHCLDLESFDEWFGSYVARLRLEQGSASTRLESMQQCNPKYLLRKHLAQQAISQAQQGDFSEVRRLHQILQTPYTEQAGYEAYCALPPAWAAQLEISCSS